MATQSSSAPISSVEDSPSPGRPMLREAQVQNAVNFLSHPRVKSSPVVHRRSFLEDKGLTKEEIDEAFCRVPDQPSNATDGRAYTRKPDLLQKSSTSLQHHGPVDTLPAGPPTSVVSTTSTKQLAKFHWSHALLAAGALAASGAGTALLFKKMVIPRLKAWIKKVVAEETESKQDSSCSNLAEEAAEAAKAAASAASAVAKASQELLSTKNEERKYFETFMGALDVQVKEMKSIRDAIRGLESRRGDNFSKDKLTPGNIATGNGSTNGTWRHSQHVNSTSNTKFGEVWSPSPPEFLESSSVALQGWLPPQPPAVALPEAADAIRRPKPPVQKQQSRDEQSAGSSDEGKERETRALDYVAATENADTMPPGTSQSEI
ncbi:peroxisomal membrane protein PEX14-like isoform X1 [Canna indica]|uniref:Peroxisomal membrane protein PEX14 n=1 Tax=Canna indica TaxID=4628 RepID=A0AAQ3K954_9LILI|nr:peroxisomal membrane protein PEX14-like isoform X1 [Canna indica]